MSAVRTPSSAQPAQTRLHVADHIQGKRPTPPAVLPDGEKMRQADEGARALCGACVRHSHPSFPLPPSYRARKPRVPHSPPCRACARRRLRARHLLGHRGPEGHARLWRHHARAVDGLSAGADGRCRSLCQAHRARAGALLLGGAEGLAFYARTDSKGMPLDAGCTYEISGQTPAARFWTLHVTGPDDRPDRARSRPADGHQFLDGAAAGRYVLFPDAFSQGAARQLGRPAGEGPLRAHLTLLDTPTAGSSGVVELDMPGIVKTGCGDA